MVAKRVLSISEVIVMCCEKCGKYFGLVLLVVGLFFLLRDFNVWNFWGIGAWTVLFILAGCAMMCRGCCKCCNDGCCNAAPGQEAGTSALHAANVHPFG